MFEDLSEDPQGQGTDMSLEHTDTGHCQHVHNTQKGPNIPDRLAGENTAPNTQITNLTAASCGGQSVYRNKLISIMIRDTYHIIAT